MFIKVLDAPSMIIDHMIMCELLKNNLKYQ